MFTSNVGVTAPLLIILILLPSSTSIPFQLDSQPLIQQAKAQVQDIIIRQNDCTGVTTTCVNLPLVSPLPPPTINQGDIEFDAKRVLDQLNRCRDGADCSNQGDETLSLEALAQSKIDSDSIQKIAQQNKCRGDDTQCSNSRTPEFPVEISITALGQSDVETDARQLVTGENKCNGSANCNNGIGAMFTAFRAATAY